MTLVVAAITPHFAILATDRRIQWARKVNGQREVLAEDDSDTKSAVVDQRYIMGFAGLGRIFRPGEGVTGTRGLRLEGWLMHELSDAKAGEHFDLIAERFGPACESAGYAGPHKFLAVGFEGDAATPCMVTIANSQRFVHSFDVTKKELGEAPFLLQTIGETPGPEVMERLHRTLTAVLSWDAYQPWPLHARFVDAIRKVATTSAGRVGDLVTVTSLPRSATPADMGVTMFSRPPEPDVFRKMEVSWTYSPDGSSDQEHPARFGEGQVISGVTAGKGAQGPLEGLVDSRRL